MGLRRALAGEATTVDTVAKEGYPPEVIADAARELEVDLIAMGTHGRTGLRHLLLGSNAERVIEHAPRPVLTVRQAVDVEQSARPRMRRHRASQA